jgi:hypothetical protein
LSGELNYDEHSGEEYCDSCFEDIKHDYSDFEDEINEAAEENPHPFDGWFGGQDRIYIPYIVKSKIEKNDEIVIDYLKKSGYIVDEKGYMEGFCSDGKRKIRIGKAIEIIGRKKAKEYLTKDSTKKDRDLDYEKTIKEETKNIISIFEKSPARQSGDKKVVYDSDNINVNNVKIVISQNSEDVAKMSTGRNWESCMTLGTGQYYSDVFCEIKAGALIAYLIKNNDDEIEHPLSRILIRRYVNAEGVSIALPESRMYGMNSRNFYLNVKEWLDQKQQSLPKGAYTRRGGTWTDKLPKKEYVRANRKQIRIKYAKINSMVVKIASKRFDNKTNIFTLR